MPVSEAAGTDVVERLAPRGVLRAAINIGNPVLAAGNATAGTASGVSVDLAQDLAARLGVGLDLVVVEKALHSVEAVRGDRADLGFFAVDPGRSEGLSFTAPYVLIEGGYLVPAASPVRRMDEVDRAGTRVAVGKGSAYDLFLSRELHDVELVRLFDAGAVVAALRAGEVEVAAGIRPQLVDAAASDPALRVLPGRFMLIEQTMSLPTRAGERAMDFLRAFVEDRKADGFVRESLRRNGIDGGTVAPPSP